jgi:uncharacterized protein
MSASPSPIIAAATAFVQAELAGNDASHDFAHIARVAASALSLAREELPDASADLLEVIELAALLHDIKDWKYSGSDTAGVDAARAFLESHAYAADKLAAVLHVIGNIGFKTELGQGAGNAVELTPALAIVQDADRLDAIGAIGVELR